MAKDSGFDSQKEQEVYFFSITSRLALGLKQPPTKWAPEPVSTVVK
jgi:hypothetical protein